MQTRLLGGRRCAEGSGANSLCAVRDAKKSAGEKKNSPGIQKFLALSVARNR
jgi:hypothetical protein